MRQYRDNTSRGIRKYLAGLIIISLLIILSRHLSSTLPGFHTSTQATAVDGDTWAKNNETWADEYICSDTCSFARDGICQEGRMGLLKGSSPPVYEVLCDLGTDCRDCGAWHYVGPKNLVEKWTPVRDLVSKGVQLNVRLTATPVSFWMPYTDPELDVDVSAQMAHLAIVESGLTEVWYKLLKKGCGGSSSSTGTGNSINGERQRGLVLDVGANFGYYTLFSAAMGCRVIAWEPVPKFSAFLKYGLLRNLFVGSVELRERVVSNHKGGKELSLVVPKTGIWGTAGIGGTNVHEAQRLGGIDIVEAISERLDEVVAPQDVLLLKIDVEGFEPEVLASAKHLLQHGNVENIIMEYSPGVAEVNRNWGLAEENPGRLLGLAQSGYSILHCDEGFRTLNALDWDAPLPEMREVAMSSLLHDVEDAKRLQQGTLGCPLPPELVETGAFWSCPRDSDAFPPPDDVFPTSFFERLNPKGFRSFFGYNTNIWAVKNIADEGCPAVRSGSVAALMREEHSGWFLPQTQLISYPYYPGHHYRMCDDLNPIEQIKYRCKCTVPLMCGALEKAVKMAAVEKRMPPLPLTGDDGGVDLKSTTIDKW